MDTYYEKYHENAATLLTDIDYRMFRSIMQTPPNVMAEKIKVANYGICTRNLNFATQLTVDVMLKLVPTGIPQHIYNHMMTFEFRPLLAPPIKPRVFSVGDLEFGFVVWLIACAISTVTFFLELLFAYLRKIIINYIGLFWLLRSLDWILIRKG